MLLARELDIRREICRSADLGRAFAESTSPVFYTYYRHESTVYVYICIANERWQYGWPMASVILLMPQVISRRCSLSLCKVVVLITIKIVWSSYYPSYKYTAYIYIYINMWRRSWENCCRWCYFYRRYWKTSILRFTLPLLASHVPHRIMRHYPPRYKPISCTQAIRAFYSWSFYTLHSLAWFLLQAGLFLYHPHFIIIWNISGIFLLFTCEYSNWIFVVNIHEEKQYTEKKISWSNWIHYIKPSTYLFQNCLLIYYYYDYSYF